MKHVRETADKLRLRYKTCDPYDLCAERGIVVLNCDLPMQMHGFYQRFRDCDLIYLNNNYPESARRVTCAHELGHALLHPAINTLFIRSSTQFVVGRFEREADFFALYLLTDGLRRFYGGKAPDYRDASLLDRMPGWLDLLRRGETEAY